MTTQMRKADRRIDLESAAKLYRAGRFAEAESAYRAAYERAPENATVLEQLGLIALWSNRLSEAEACFEAALRRKRLWPFNAQLHYRLGLTHYRQDRLADAAQCFNAAAGPVALGPFRELQAFGRHMALCATEPSYALDGPAQCRVPFVVTDPLPVIEVRVNGRPAHFFIDTGGAEVILDRAWASEVGAPLAGAFSGSYGGQQTAATGLGRIDLFQVGDYAMRNVPIHTLDMSGMASIFGSLNVRGIIGTRYLMHFLATLDYAHGALILRRPTPEALRQFMEISSNPAACVCPMWLAETHYVLAWGRVNHLEPMLFLVDTGLAACGFTATEPVLHAAGISVDWTQAGDGVGGGGRTRSTNIVVERLTLGSGENEVVEHNVPGVVLENSLAILKDQLGFRVSGLISHQFFRRHALTFDFSGMRLIVQTAP